MESNDLLQRADDTFSAQDLDSALVLYMKAAEAADRESNNSVLVEAISQIGRCHLKRKDLDLCRHWLEKAESKATSDEPLGWSRYLSVKGRLEWQEEAEKTGELAPVVEKASATFTEMYQFCLANQLYKRAIDAANMMTIVGKLEDRIGWGEKGIKAAEAGGFESQLAILWNNRGWNLQDLGRFTESLEALKTAREYHYKGGKELPKLIADWSVGFAYRMVGDVDSAGKWMADVYKRADSLYEQRASIDHAEWLGFSAKEMGEIDLAKGNSKAALAYFEAAKAMLEKADMPEWDKKGYDELENKIAELKE